METVGSAVRYIYVVNLQYKKPQRASNMVNNDGHPFAKFNDVLHDARCLKLGAGPPCDVITV